MLTLSETIFISSCYTALDIKKKPTEYIINNIVKKII